MLSGLAHGYGRSGNRPEAQKLLAALIAESRTQYVSPYYIAIVYAGLGNRNEARAWLEKAFAERANGLVFLKVEPELDDLRENPSFLALQRKLNLPG